MTFDLPETVNDIAPETSEIEPTSIEKLMLLANKEGDISEALSEDLLLDIGSRVVEDYETDRKDRTDWSDTVAEALKAASQEAKGETKTYPWPNASNINYPLLTVAALQFNARAYPAIVKGDEAVSVKVVGKDKGRPLLDEQGQPVMRPVGVRHNGGPPIADPQQPPQMEPVWLVRPGGKSARAQRVRDYLNTVLFYRMDDWEEDTDALLLQLPVVGCVFRKIWYDAVADRHCAAMVPALRIFAPKGAKTCETTPRLTEEIPDQYPVDIMGKQREGFYRDVDLYGIFDEQPKTDRLANFDHEPRMLLEQHRLIDLDEDGLPEPYIVTVDLESRKVLRIEPNFSVDSITHDGARAIRIEKGRFYVKYDFFPDPQGGFYGIGLGHLLKQIGAVIDTTINLMLDAAHAQVAGGGFIGSGIRLTGTKRSSNLRFAPGEYKTVDVPGDQLRNGIVERTFPGPSPILFQLLGMMQEAARDISSVKDVITGDASNNGQVGTTLALIEQGLQVFTAIYKRTYRALKAEYTLLFKNIGRYANDATKQDYATVLDDEQADFAKDFDEKDMDIRPVSDPASVTRMQKMARAQFLGQFVAAPGVNPQAILKRMCEAADVDDIDELLAPPAPPPVPNPKDVAGAKKLEAGATLDMEKAHTESVRRSEVEADIASKNLENLAKAFGAGQTMGLVA